MVDDDDVHRPRLRFQLESELFLQSLLERRSVRVGLEVDTGRQGAIELGVNSIMKSNFPVSPVLSNTGRSTPVISGR